MNFLEWKPNFRKCKKKKKIPPKKTHRTPGPIIRLQDPCGTWPCSGLQDKLSGMICILAAVWSLGHAAWTHIHCLPVQLSCSHTGKRFGPWGLQLLAVRWKKAKERKKVQPFACLLVLDDKTGWLNWLERRTQDPITRGSNPVKSTIKEKRVFPKSKCCADSLSVCPTHVLYTHS